MADLNLNTLIDYRYARHHEAKNGEAGRGSDQFGAAGDDIVLRMPVGTIISDAETGDKLIELLEFHGFSVESLCCFGITEFGGAVSAKTEGEIIELAGQSRKDALR